MGLYRLYDRWLRSSRDGGANAWLRARLGPSLWTADRAEIQEARLTIHGWALPPFPDTAATFAINGRCFDRVETGHARPDLERVYSFVTGAGRAGFSASVKLTADELSGQIPIEFDFVDARTLQPFRPWQREAHWPAALERYPLPDAARVKRVHGSPDEAAYRLVGYSNYRKIQSVLEERVGRNLRTFQAALDWGCGSGRLLRYLIEAPGIVVTGADIDSDNLSWCRTHFPGRFVELPLHPPSTLPLRAFDLAIGLSIFTHLTETVQHEWLKELQRVMVPGGILLMSIHGPTVHAMSQDVSFCQRVDDRGIIDGNSHDLDDVLEDKSYYRTTHHSHAYVRAEWSKYFDIVDILPACVGNVQDLVVMRAR